MDRLLQESEERGEDNDDSGQGSEGNDRPPVNTSRLNNNNL